jgi:micrococcal nuclease
VTSSRASALLGALLLVVFAVAVFRLGAGGGAPASSGATSTRPIATRSAAPATPATSARPHPELRPDGETQAASLVRVTDGDTIVVDIDGTRERVRYVGIDAPEVDHADATAEPFGDAATAANARLLAAGTLILERDVSERDRFGRLLRHVWILAADGQFTFVSLELMRDGLARTLEIRPDVKDAALFRDAELEAKRTHVGMWAD